MVMGWFWCESNLVQKRRKEVSDHPLETDKRRTDQNTLHRTQFTLTSFIPLLGVNQINFKVAIFDLTLACALYLLLKKIIKVARTQNTKPANGLSYITRTSHVPGPPLRRQGKCYVGTKTKFRNHELLVTLLEAWHHGLHHCISNFTVPNCTITVSYVSLGTLMQSRNWRVHIYSLAACKTEMGRMFGTLITPEKSWDIVYLQTLTDFNKENLKEKRNHTGSGIDMFLYGGHRWKFFP